MPYYVLNLVKSFCDIILVQNWEEIRTSFQVRLHLVGSELTVSHAEMGLRMSPSSADCRVQILEGTIPVPWLQPEVRLELF